LKVLTKEGTIGVAIAFADAPKGRGGGSATVNEGGEAGRKFGARFFRKRKLRVELMMVAAFSDCCAPSHFFFSFCDQCPARLSAIGAVLLVRAESE